ncbi:MAG: PDZ domain-containing protein [Negativicutes bacterium]
MLLALLISMFFCSQVFANASVVINHVKTQPVMDRVLLVVTKDIPTSRVETMNQYSVVLLSVDSVSIGLFGTGTRENRMIFNFVPAGENLVLSVSEIYTIIHQNGARETQQVVNNDNHLSYLKEIKYYFNGKYRFGYTTTDKKAGEGFLIGEIAPDSSFEEAGIKAGDVMISINDTKVRKEKEKYLNASLVDQSDPKPAKFVIIQNGQEKVFTLSPKYYPGEYQNNSNTSTSANNSNPVLEANKTYQVVRNYANGDRYEGDVVNGNLQGKGVFTWANGDRYEGDFVNNRMHGKGILTYANGDRYEGEFVNSKYHGKGVLLHANGVRQEGTFIDGKYSG